MPPNYGCHLSREASVALFVVSILLFSSVIHPVFAHEVDVFAWVKGDTVFVEGYYGGSKKAKNALVEVFDPAGTRLIEGRTDEEGEFSFKIPIKTALRIVLTVGTGHKSDFILSARDLGSITPSSAEPIPQIRRRAAEFSTADVDMHQLELIINQALERKLDPVIKLIRSTRREGPSVTEIIGGIGYIFGLFGVVMYFKSRKERK